MTKRKQNRNKMNKTYEIITNNVIIYSLKSQKEEKKEGKVEKVLKEIMNEISHIFQETNLVQPSGVIHGG